ncbi:hypothetical protein EJB05_43668 [Eragrostis curvula]|uniref:Photolyase/cryptochrome alpha/beta domain-containing protein n=1 Tax=Eragrostis curvula TaxID=38414 RepID=A0A5J9TG20_9POAL|nr:hypothetical protein EJB05_43668 [Eragrostis curvula]
MGAPGPRPSYLRSAYGCCRFMALLQALRLGPLTPAPRRRWSRSRCRIAASNAAAPGKAAVVWFKHDLRIDDHPGLVAAAAEPRRPVVPLYVFDHRILADQYSWTGGNENGFLTTLITVTHLPMLSGYSDKKLELLLFALKDLKMVLKSQESDLLIGLGNAEDVILRLVNEVTMQDSLPTLEELKGFLKDSRMQEDNWISLKSTPAKSILKRTFNQRKIKSSATSSISNEGSIEDTAMGSGTSGRRIINSMFASESSLEVRGGTEITLDALAAYLKYLEGTGKASWQERSELTAVCRLHDKVRLAEIRNGASFDTLFSTAIQLGVISRRRVYHEAIEYEKDRNAGFLSPFGYSTPTVTAAVEAICSMEYTFYGHEGPAVLLVHGFAAFLEHFRDNIGNIADAGHRVWAITMVGFGKSEKPNVNYSELFWSELLRDFISDVVREPAHLVGNSMGGYICAIMAGLWPSVAKSLVLLNPAGSIVPNYPFIPLNEVLVCGIFESKSTGKTDFMAFQVVGTASFTLLESYDPGATKVIESIFNFNLSIPLNFLFDSFGGRILVIQGMKDPLIKSEAFVTMLREHCRKVCIRELEAGHAPHDEVPDEVNSLLCEWMEESEVKPSLEMSKAI